MSQSKSVSLSLPIHETDIRQLRTFLGQYATGVTVVTTVDKNNCRVGMTANSFSSVSLDPPLILWSIAKTASNVDDFCHCERFAINILNEEQQLASNHFAKSSADKFADLEMVENVMGIPILNDALTTLICKPYQIYEGGDHHIIVGEIEFCKHNGGNPLVFHNGKYHQTQLHPAYKTV